MQIGTIKLENLKADLYFSGEVQLEGFRTIVKQCALHYKIAGDVRNEDDGTVRVFYDGPKDVLEKFKKDVISKAAAYKIKVAPTVIVHEEGDPNYKGRWRDYKGFQIDYTNIPVQEVLEVGTMHARRLIYEVSELRNDVDDNHKDLARRYGKISKSVGGLDKTLRFGFSTAGSALRDVGTDVKRLRTDITAEAKKSRQVLERMDKKLTKIGSSKKRK